MATALLISLFLLCVNIQSVRTHGTIYANRRDVSTPTASIQSNGSGDPSYAFSRFANWTISANYSDPIPFGPFPLVGSFAIILSYADDVITLNISSEHFYFEPIYNLDANITLDFELMPGACGKIYTSPINKGDVDIISKTNDTGTYFLDCETDTWQPAAPQYIGDGDPDPASSSWLYIPINITRYLGEYGQYLGYKPWYFWYTTGYCENTVDQNGSRLDGYYINATGVPFGGINGTVTYVNTGASTNFTVTYPEQPPFREDAQAYSELAGAGIPVGSGSLLSPADIYITDPLNKSIGSYGYPNRTIVIFPMSNAIPDAFYTGAGSEPERIIIPNPLNGTYKILITGTGNGTYTFMADFALSTNITERAKHVYNGSIVTGGVLQSKVEVNGTNVTSYQPVSTIGDINQDGIVDIFDLRKVGKTYGSAAVDDPETPWDETQNWNPIVDLDLDREIDIFDVRKAARHYLETV